MRHPAMLMAPKRVKLVVFGANCTTNVPLPLPDEAPVTVSHETVGAALHAQPAGAVTVTVWVPPVTFMLTGLTR